MSCKISFWSTGPRFYFFNIAKNMKDRSWPALRSVLHFKGTGDCFFDHRILSWRSYLGSNLSFFTLGLINNVFLLKKPRTSKSFYFPSKLNRKVWWQHATLLVFINLYTLDTFTHHSFINIHWGPSPYLHSCRLSGWNLHGVASRPRFELGPALQQASALPTEQGKQKFSPHIFTVVTFRVLRIR
jgi:hypothetical protein